MNKGENRLELLDPREAGGRKQRLVGVFEEEAQRG